MGNSLRCCLACVIPCGALDVIRIVHLNGQVEEITRPISAGEVLSANPNYVLSKPSSQGVVRRILILSPESDLKRGNIYFLIPASSLSSEKKKHTTTTTNNKKKSKKIISSSSTTITNTHDQTLTLSEKKQSLRRHRRRESRASRDWRPHLESISEDSKHFSTVIDIN
ncbi:Protein of unknown function DUF4228 [Macleaya cordata]|uniref:Uncharacterized protein n=1 Tax=Macleaya cordata TaxID=56857 RepID=A0A200R3C3_MACCD|nr:Protein of unknown function DUF4228 [Macleaya cordata]